ncbi:MAG: hypothetical protein ACYC0V_04050 [Armatimonadota bacterium]
MLKAETLTLAYKLDAAEAQERMRAFWAGEMIDRPCVSILTPKKGVAAPYITHISAPDLRLEEGIARFDEWASCVYFGGELMPTFRPDFGPDQFAAFIGAYMQITEDGLTSWIEPFVEDWSTLKPFTIHPDNIWWRAVLEITALAAEMGDGKFIIRTLDMHTNMDCLSAIRGAGRLCTDMIDYPDELLKALEWVDGLFNPVYDAVFAAGRMKTRGSTSWADMWSDGRTETIQCDFCFMIGPEHFRKFVLPSLEYELSCLDTAIYHLDGPGEVRHLDDLLAIADLDCIQWIPGSGQPSAPAWVDMLQKIQNAGKSIQVYVSADELKALHPQLKPNRVFYTVTGGCADEKEAEDLLKWLKKNS